MPSKNELSQRVSRLSPEKRALLEKRLRGEIDRKPEAQIPRTDRYGELPASFAQMRLWFFDQLEPQSPTYNIPLAIRMSGKLDIHVFRRSLDEIARRHEVLRTSFKIGRRGQPIQIIEPPKPVELSIIDLEPFPTTIRDSKAIEMAEESARKPFDLNRAPLWRINLFRNSNDEYLFLLVMHHSISDGWSKEIFLQELAKIYEAYSNGRPSPLPEITVQYVDYAAWQRERLKGERLEALFDYWKTQLKGDLPVLELPLDYPRPAAQTFSGENYYFRLPGPILESLKSFSQDEGATIFMSLMAVFDILLWRYTGQTDLLIGTPISNRERRELEGLIGYFVDTLVIRGNVSGNPSAREVVCRIREAALGAFENRELPFEKLVDGLDLERNLSYTPIFQVMFALQNAPAMPVEIHGLRMERLEIETGTSMFDLTLVVTEIEQGLDCYFEYNIDLFNAETVRRMASHFQTLLSSMLSNPDQPISKLKMLSAPEETQILIEWRGGNEQSPQAKTLVQIFEEQVSQTPENMALIFREQKISYRELNRRANKLAHYLRAKGVSLETPVAVCLPYSSDMMVALIGVLKAGGVYVPLDPDHPAARLGFMIEDSSPRLILTQEPFNEKLASFPVETLSLDDIVPDLTSGGVDNPSVNIVPENLAYIIYTSGSMGKPKGVMIQHGAIGGHCEMIRDCYGLKPGDRVLQFTQPIFDASLEQIFTAFSSGAAVVLREQEIWQPGELKKKITQMGVTVIDLPPAYWLQAVDGWIGEPGEAVNDQLRLVIVGGDILPSESLRIWRKSSLHDTRLINAYGPTETTITATLFEVMADIDAQNTLELVPIGRPVAGKKVYVLDTSGSPVPAGIPGELYIGGLGLGRGYLNRPELTAERFIPDPFADTPGARMYKTGDRVRFLADGNLVYLGRLDEQVKVRGYRIELGEIEARLGSYPGVREVFVTTRQGQPGEQQIIAYVVTETGDSIDASNLYTYLSKYLPAYMLPSGFVQVDEIPRTFSNKVDRQALPEPDFSQAKIYKAYVVPESATEKIIASVWSEVLEIAHIGLSDNFFELGGHSLLATRVISRLQDECKVRLPLRALFEAPTVAGLAEQIEAIRWANQRKASDEADEDREEIVL
jgi:amino acid adenylation domain-containing protein